MSSRAYAQYTISDIRDGVDGVGILEIEEQYYKSRCNTPPLAQNDSSYNEDNWDTQPIWEEGYYIWTRVKITWDNDVNNPEHITYTTPVLATTYQSLHSDIINNIIPNIATKDSNGNWSIVSGVLHNTFVYYTDEEGQQQPVRLENLGSTIVQTANEIRQEVSNNYITSNEIDASYVICNTSASTATKIATCYNQDASSSFELGNGTRITCVFANGNTAENPTLSVNGTTAKPIKTFAGNTLIESEYTWDAGTTFTLVYNTSNGGSWNIEGSEGELKVYSNSTLIDQTANNILIQATKNSNTASAAGSALIQSFINVAPEQIKISADRINFEGSAVFSSFVTDGDLEAAQGDIEEYVRNLTSDMATNTSVSNTYATKTTAIKRSQRIYKQTNQVDANNNPVVPDPATDLRNPSTNLDTWVATNVAVYDAWTTKRMSYSRDYPYIWTCEQRETVSGELAYTPVLLDDTTTVIDGGSIITNSIAANRIIAHSITSNELATNVVTSLNYSPPTVGGTAPYSVTGSTFDLQYGNIITPNFVVDNENGNAYLKGTIETRKGLIGGFVIDENAIYHNKREISSVDLSDDVFIISSDPYVLDEEDYLYGGYASLYEVYVGTDGISCGFGKFAVDSTGELFASNATIKGTINATSGTFGFVNGYYNISTNGLIGYITKRYYRLVPLTSNRDYIAITSIEVTTSSNTYSYSDIQAMNHFESIGISYDEDDEAYATLYLDTNIALSTLFVGTITSIDCYYTYDDNGSTENGFDGIINTGEENPSIPFVDSPISTGTEIGYDYVKTGNLIANGGSIDDSVTIGGTTASTISSKTNCITEISNTGIWVTPSNRKPNSDGTAVITDDVANNIYSTTGTYINTSGVDIYRNGYLIASYGDTITLGKYGQSRLQIGTSVFSMLNSANDSIYSINPFSEDRDLKTITIATYTNVNEVAVINEQIFLDSGISNSETPYFQLTINNESTVFSSSGVTYSLIPEQSITITINSTGVTDIRNAMSYTEYSFVKTNDTTVITDKIYYTEDSDNVIIEVTEPSDGANPKLLGWYEQREETKYYPCTLSITYLSTNVQTVLMSLMGKNHIKGTNNIITVENETWHTTNNKTDTFFRAYNSVKGTNVYFGVGSGGENHGIWSGVLRNWLIYADKNGQVTTRSDFLFRASGHRIYGYGTYTGSRLYCFGNNEEITRIATKTMSKTNTGLSFVIANGYYAIGSAGSLTDQDSRVYLVGGCDESGYYLRSYPTYKRKYSSKDYSPNMFITDKGTIGRIASSSIRYKHDVEYLTNEEKSIIDEEKKIKKKLRKDSSNDLLSILDIPVVKFKFNDGYVNGEPDFDYSKPIVGLIADDVASICPECATYIKDAKGNDIPESYNTNQLLVRMLYVIQQHEKRIEELESKIEYLESCIQNTK